METEPNTNLSKSSVINDTLLDKEFIGYINTLSTAILEFYKVSKNININKDLLINYGIKELSNENILKYSLINVNGSNTNEILINLISILTNIFKELDFNNKSQQNNLYNFFVDSKLLFKKLKEKRHEIITEGKKKSFTQISTSSKNSYSKNKLLYDNIQTYNNIVTEENMNNKSSGQKKVNINNLKNKNDSQIDEQTKKKSTGTLGKNSVQSSRKIDEEYFNDIDKNLNSLSEFGAKNPMNNIIHISSNEIQRLKSINRQLSSELRKYKSKTVDKIEGINNQNNNNFNNFEKINIYIKDKDKLISSLKEEMNQTNESYNNTLNKYKNEILKLKKENNLLKVNNSHSSNNNNTELNIKFSNLKKENRHLKNNLEDLKMSNYKSEYNARINKKFSCSEEKNNIRKENNELKNKIKILEKKFGQKQEENIELNNTVIILKKMLEEEKVNLSKKNSELSGHFDNQDNELLNLRRENMNYYNQLENKNLMDNQGFNMQQKMNYDENIQQMKKEYEIEISNYNNKIIDLQSNLEKSKKLKFELNSQILTLKKQISEKDAKLLEQNYQLQQMQANLNSQKIANQKLLNEIQNQKKGSENKENIHNLNEKLEEQQNLNNDLTDELSKVKNDNELLKNKILSSEKKITKLNETANLQKAKDKEIYKLKNEIQSLQFQNEKLNFTIKEYKENISGFNEEKLAKKMEEIEGLKQLIRKLQLEREKSDNELTTLKRENEKIQNQMIRLSKKLPEEYNELQKQYQELENKYYTLKNKNPNNITPKKGKNEEINEDKNAKELKELKKEIEQLKKKNFQLVAQLEDKEINKNYFENRSEDGNKSNYEEEFDLRKMAKGAKDKNRSQDINIDYPGIQTYKEKVRELEFYYNSLENLVKKLLLNIQCNPKNKTYVAELCKIVGFDLETTNKILTNKNKNFILGFFSKQ